MINYLVPGIAMVIIIYGLYKKVDIYDSFTQGVREGISSSLKIFPTIFAMTIAVSILTNSNIIIDISKLFNPFFIKLHFPKEVFPLVLMKPISGSSSIVILNDILSKYHPDSYIGRISSVICASTDTTIYILSLYFGSIGVKKTKYALIVGLLADLICIFIAIILVNLIY